MENHTFNFECSSTTHLDCVGRNLAGSNKQWPPEIKSSDYADKNPDTLSGFSLARTGWIRPATQVADASLNRSTQSHQPPWYP